MAKIAAFLRELNAAENLRQIRKRVQFVRDHRQAGNTQILKLAIRDCQDVLTVLGAKSLAPGVQHEAAIVRQTLLAARGRPDRDRVPSMDSALVHIDLARTALLSANPSNDF